jgi:hypothetical protein
MVGFSTSLIIDNKMNRRNAMTIQLTETGWKNSEFMMLLSELQNEVVLYEQPQYGDGIFWFDNGVPGDLFKYSDAFEWISNTNGNSGNAGLYYEGKALTKDNYRTPIYANVDPYAIAYTEERTRTIYDGETMEPIEETYDFIVEPEKELTGYTYASWLWFKNVPPVQVEIAEELV